MGAQAMRLIATRPLRYPANRRNTRALVAGDLFEAPRRDAELLVYACKRAAFANEIEPVPLAPDVDVIDRLRLVAERLGIEVDRRWGARRLQAEIEAKRAMARPV